MPFPDQEPSDQTAYSADVEGREIVWPKDPVQRKKAIELELTRIRKEASAARLEARAAKLESMLRDMDQGVGRADTVDNVAPFESWQDVRDAQIAASVVLPHESSSSAIHRTDEPHSVVRRPAFLNVSDDSPMSTDRKFDEVAVSDLAEVDQTATNNDRATPFSAFNDGDDDVAPSSDTAFDLVEDDEGEIERSDRNKKRPFVVLASVALHVLLLVFLGWFTLQVSGPKDQIAFTGSPSTASEIPVESMSIETTEVEVQPETPTTDVEYQISPVGDIVAAKFSPDPVDAPSSPMMNSGVLGQPSSAAMSLSQGSSESKIEFCGIKGGGNHFVYLVDSSGSMGDAFASARLELLRSIELLKPDQRFYVVFFDEEPDYMRLSNPTMDETSSMMATTGNKEKLRQWAMRITMNRGRAPYDPIEFALGLRPDVIFLLSDGEFPERLVEKLDQENRIENLFGDVKPISIVHTIGYHSREGEARMKVIAKKNGGQYRYIPDPSKPR